jgi:hypothetical protein
MAAAHNLVLGLNDVWLGPPLMEYFGRIQAVENVILQLAATTTKSFLVT